MVYLITCIGTVLGKLLGINFGQRCHASFGFIEFIFKPVVISSHYE